MAGLDIFFDYGAAGSGLPLSRDDLYAEFKELREQYLSGMQSFAWSGGGSYIGRDDCYMVMRSMLRKLGALDGKDYGAGDGRIRSVRIVPRDPAAARCSLAVGVL